MPRLDEDARAMLEAYSDTVQPSAASRGRNRARLLERIEAADDPPEAAVSPVESPSDSRRWWPVVAVAAAIAAAVALGWAARGSLTQTSAGAPSQAEDAIRPLQTTRQTDASLAGPSKPRRVESGGALAVPSVPSPPEQETAAAPAPSPETDQATPRRRKPDRASETPAASVRSKDVLAEEVELISQARAQLLEGKDGAALATFLRHRSAFPKGVLAEERNAWIATLQCRLGRAAGRKSAEAFLSAHPKSPHARRVRKTCLSSVTDPVPTEE